MLRCRLSQIPARPTDRTLAHGLSISPNQPHSTPFLSRWSRSGLSTHDISTTKSMLLILLHATDRAFPRGPPRATFSLCGFSELSKTLSQRIACFADVYESDLSPAPKPVYAWDVWRFWLSASAFASDGCHSDHA